jgi:hypothetical protein
MNANKPTYTRSQAMSALGIKSASTFHHLRNKYPEAFVVLQEGMGRNHPTLYDKNAVDKFIEWRKLLKNYEHFKDIQEKVNS